MQSVCSDNLNQPYNNVINNSIFMIKIKTQAKFPNYPSG